jgi:prolyl 4-hydroxylase
MENAAQTQAVQPVFQPVTDDLRQWIVAQAEAGCRPADVLAAMKASGWVESVAIHAMEQTLSKRLEELHGPTPVLPSVMPASAAAVAAVVAAAATPALAAAAQALPEPLMADACVLRLSDGHEVQVLAHMKSPRVIVFGGLLTDAECEGLMALAQARLTRSETVDNATGGNELNPGRTSDGMFFDRGEKPLITQIEQRIGELLNWPVNHGEGLQILRYRPGAEYRPHHDYFDPAHPGSARILERGGQRVGTLVMYLNTPTGGGATIFPETGFEVAPLRGNAVFFSYERAHVSTRTLHGGAPVTAGEKWVATKWLREGVFV